VFRRRQKNAAAAPATTATIERPPEPVDELPGSLQEIRAEIESLSESNRRASDRSVERRLMALRHAAGIHLIDSATGSAEFVAPATQDLAPADPLPEIAASDLSAALIRAGILRDGCLLVRGLVAREDALALAADIDRAFAERDGVETGGLVAPGYYEEFRPTARYGGEVYGRPWIKQGGGLLAADSPMLSFRMMEMFRAARLREVVSEYLGEPALISVHKTTLRKADPSVPGAWHQDGFFMGEVRSLNLWLSLSRCGDEAPGLDILPRRLESYVATATEEAALDYTISQKRVQEAAGDTPVIRPIFEPGDALFFDELFLHQTGSDPSMPKPRFAVENWFFGGSGFPDEYAPIAV
jgi:hypothetical protein